MVDYVKSAETLMFESASRFPVLSPARMRALAVARDAGDTRARHTMFDHNQRLAFSMIHVRPGESREDLVQAALMGVWRATEDWNPDKGAFSTHAGSWIRQSVGRERERTGPSVRLPTWAYHKAPKVKALAKQGLAVPDIASQLNMREQAVKELLRWSEQLRSVGTFGNPLGEEGPEFEVADDAYTPEEHVVIEDERADAPYQVVLALGNLTKRQREVVLLHWGIGAEEELNNAQIAEMLGMGRQNVQQVLKTAEKRVPGCIRRQRGKRRTKQVPATHTNSVA